MQALNIILAFPFQYFTRDRQPPSKVHIDTLKLPHGSDRSIDDYLKVCLCNRALPNMLGLCDLTVPISCAAGKRGYFDVCLELGVYVLFSHLSTATP